MATRKRGAAKKKAPAKAVPKPAPRKRASPALNKARLREDINYYEENYYDTNRRTKPSSKHKKGIQLKNLVYRNGRYTSSDGDIDISREEYDKLAVNPKAVPQYIPIKEGKKTVRYYNKQTGHVVTPYYRTLFGKEFRKVDTDEEVQRATAYEQSNRSAQSNRTLRHYDLINSYALRHPEFKQNYSSKDWRNAIANDPNFQRLVGELQGFNYRQLGITPENIATIDTILGGSYDDATVEREQGLLIAKLGEDPEYQRVLVELGRRLPGETRPVGGYGPGYIKTVVIPYYEDLKYPFGAA